MHFLQLTALIKLGLRERLQKRERDIIAKNKKTGVLNNVYNWFVASKNDSAASEEKLLDTF